VPAAAALENAAACKRHFTPERWRSFSRDVAWFRSQLPLRRWKLTQTDHGYNGTPAWGLFGGLLAHSGPATDAQILALRLIDPLLLLLTWAAVGWTFGWRVLCVALLYWGTNYPAQYGWVGGSYLRQIEFAALPASEPQAYQCAGQWHHGAYSHSVGHRSLPVWWSHSSGAIGSGGKPCRARSQSSCSSARCEVRGAWSLKYMAIVMPKNWPIRGMQPWLTVCGHRGDCKLRVPLTITFAAVPGGARTPPSPASARTRFATQQSPSQQGGNSAA